MNYYYNSNLLYLLAYSYCEEVGAMVLSTEKDRSLTVSDKISIVTAVENIENCIFIHQLEYNNIQFYAVTKNLLNQTLKNIKTEFVLVINTPSVLVHDLDNGFIETFKGLNTPFTFGATTLNNTKYNFLSFRELKLKGTSKGLEAGVCFGYTKDVALLYSRINQLDFEYGSYEKAHQAVEVTLIAYYSDGLPDYLDSANKLFCSVDLSYVQVKEIGGKREIVEPEKINNRRIF